MFTNCSTRTWLLLQLDIISFQYCSPMINFLNICFVLDKHKLCQVCNRLSLKLNQAQGDFGFYTPVCVHVRDGSVVYLLILLLICL